MKYCLHRQLSQYLVVDALAIHKNIHQPDEELFQVLRLDPARIAWYGLSAVGPVVVRILVAEASSRRLSNPSNPPLPSCRSVR